MLADINVINEGKIIHSKTAAKKYLFTGIIIVTVLMAVFPVIETTSRIGTYEFSATVQSIGSLFAIIAGLALLAWFSRTGIRWQLFIGLAYFINGIIELSHGFFSFVSLLYQKQIPLDVVLKIVDATEITGELFLLTLLTLSLLTNIFFTKTKSPKFETFLFFSTTVALAIAMVILFYNLQYKQATNYNNIVSHPVNLLFAFIIFLVTLSYMFSYIRNNEMLKWWIFLSLSVMMISQAYISFSKFPYDTLFEIGLILEVVGYMIMLSGIFLYMMIRIRQMSEAETQLIDQKAILQDIVSKQTIELREKNASLVSEISLKDRLYQSLISSKAELKKSEAHFRELFENSIIGMYQTTPSGKILTANKVLCKLLGFNSFTELQNHNSNVNNYIKYGEREKFKNIIESKGYITGFETRWLSKNEKEIYVRESTKKKTLNDNMVIYEGTIEDITAQKLAEKQKKQTVEELKSIIESVNVPVFGINKNKEISIWNLSAEETTGYLKDEVYGKSITHSFIQNIFEDKIVRLTDNALSGIEVSDFEFSLKPKKGKRLKFLLNITTQHDNSDNVTGVIFIVRNITQLDKYKNELEKKVEARTRELKTALEKEKELGELKSRFVSMASHEFRTPLAAISFAAGFVLKYWQRLDNSTREQKLLKIENQVNHMIFLLDGVLTIGKAEAGKIKINRKLFKFKDFFDPLIEEITSAKLNSHKIKYVNVSNNCEIYIDEHVGRNIFINLLINAIKFSPNARFVNIECRFENNFTVIDIVDFGIGISDKEIDKVFMPFHRAENVKTIQGTGLGLAIVKESVEQHNGTITVKSEVGKGTRFTVSLPLP